MGAVLAPVPTGTSSRSAGRSSSIIMFAIALLSPRARESRRTGRTRCTLTPSTRSAIPTGPSATFWFGVDTAGRDLFVRVAYGARTSLFIAFFATGIAIVIGVILGILAGFYRGKVDTVISRMIDIVLSLPVLLLALGLVSACGLSAERLPRRADPAGALARQLRDRPVQLALHRAHRPRAGAVPAREGVHRGGPVARGSTNRRIMFREVLPNVAAPIIVYTTLIIPNNILFEAALSFLGIGVPQDDALLGAAAVRRELDLHGGLVDDAVPRAVPVLHDPRLQPRRGRAPRRPRSQDGRLTVSSREAAFLKGGGRPGVPEER